jgi:hypothetical protein
MAAQVGMSQSAVSQIWRRLGLTPPGTKAWKLSVAPSVVGIEPASRREHHDMKREIQRIHGCSERPAAHIE